VEAREDNVRPQIPHRKLGPDDIMQLNNAIAKLEYWYSRCIVFIGAKVGLIKETDVQFTPSSKNRKRLRVPGNNVL
jgi:hypothetical protein